MMLNEKIHRLLTHKHRTVATAESCTGGLLAAELTRLPGSSAFFKLGVIVYSNQAKAALLGVPDGLLKGFGAVSEQAARSMAQKVRQIATADIGVSVTGIAGPGGATKRKPVGTVFIAVSTDTGTFCSHCRFKGTRSRIRRQAVIESLKSLKTALAN